MQAVQEGLFLVFLARERMSFIRRIETLKGGREIPNPFFIWVRRQRSRHRPLKGRLQIVENIFEMTPGDEEDEDTGGQGPQVW